MVCRFFTGLAGFVAFALTPWTGATPTEGHKIMMAGPSAYAIEVGREISARGGNAIDVAVAMGLSLTVTSPYFGALGGGGFALLKMKGGVEVLDFRETAPAATFPDYFKNLPEDASVNGGHAVGVPGWPAGLYALHRKHGVLKWKDLFVRPVEMAEKGFRVTGEWVAKTNGNVDRFNAAGKKYFRKAGNTAYKPGEILKQKSLGLALQKFRDLGPSGFYQGSVAADIVKSVQAAGGKMTVADLKSYKVRWLTPLEAQYAGYKIYLMPPPSSGGIVIKSALSLMEVMGRKDLAPLSVEELHWLAEIEKRAYRGRALLGDPDFYKNPLNMLASDKYLREMADSFSRRKATSLKPLSPRDIKESTETTHYSVLDSNGNAVAITVTLNGSYGSGVVSDRFGIALNNEMDDFTIQLGEANMYGLVQGEGNKVEAGKRPLSSMSPTLVENDGKIIMTLGAPGGPRIISGVLQALYRILGTGADIDWAIQAPRVHHQFLPDTLYVDKDRLTPETLDGLKKKGHKIETGWMAKVYVVRLRPDGILEAAFDSRGEGAAGGY